MEFELGNKKYEARVGDIILDFRGYGWIISSKLERYYPICLKDGFMGDSYDSISSLLENGFYEEVDKIIPSEEIKLVRI